MRTWLAASVVVLGVGLAGAARAEQWNMQSTYPGSLTQLGTLGRHVAEQLKLVTGGDVELVFHEPGALVPAPEVFDAVGSGDVIKAAWSSPGYWAGKVSALQLFAAAPFGPEAAEYLAWLKFGGGRELLDEIYRKHGIHGVPCGIVAPEASGWFRNEITSVDDLKDLKMRFFGLGAKVMEKLGVSIEHLDGADIFPALENGTIDAAEVSMPAIDLDLGFYQVARHYYFPGWHQQSTLFDLMINLALWESLDGTTRAQIDAVCDAAITYGLAEGEAIQFKALQELEKNGAIVHRWPPEVLVALKAAWTKVVAEQAAADADFARVWESLSSFRENYARWKELGYLD